jgi:hypothetical protein
MDCCRGWAGWLGQAIAFLVFLTMERSIYDVRILFHVPPLSSPALPPALLAPLPLPAPARVPKEVCLSQGGRRSMLLRRRALCCIRIKNHFDLIFVVAGQSASFFTCPPSCPVRAPAPASPCARTQRSMFVTRGKAEYASQKESAALHPN